MNDLSATLRTARKRLLRMHYESGVGHIGGNLSCLDMLIVLYHRVLRPEDMFVLSKGHAAGALYVALWSVGALSDDDLTRFHQDDTPLSGHPAPNRIPQIPFATGSLGHGLSLAAGTALGKRLKNESGRVYCLLSDGECQEGSTWEGVQFAAKHRLPVTVFVDANGLQGFGTTQEIAGLEPLAEKFRSFGMPTVEIDGHDPQALLAACEEERAGPLAVIARTQKGNGVSYMENRMEWHYLPMSEAQYTQANAELSRE